MATDSAARFRRRTEPATPPDPVLSKRPSRHGVAAGTEKGTRGAPDAAGLPLLLAAAVDKARTELTPQGALERLLSLAGHVPADVGRKALTRDERAGVACLERDGRVPCSEPVFTGALGITATGKVVVAVPTRRHVHDRADLFDAATTVGWSRDDVEAFRVLAAEAARREAAEVDAARRWLSGCSTDEVAALVEDIREAASRTAPFVLYRGHTVYSNFRGRNNLTGKSLLRTHPDCAFHGLEHLPLDLWTDDDVLVTVCLTLLIRSGGYGRIEECNGTQLDLASVAALFAECARSYGDVDGDGGVVVPALAPGAEPDVDALAEAAEGLRRRSAEVKAARLVYREIYGPLLHKRERIAITAATDQRERRICEALSEHLPLPAVADLDEAAAALRADDAWLARPSGSYGTGLEHLVQEVVEAAVDAFDAEFAMSRGLRDLSALAGLLAAEAWDRLVAWELPEYFCCVVPSTSALPVFGGSWPAVADAAWAMSARMQYNSWHFLPGSLPRVPVVEARDWFVPPTVPDIAHFSDQHHRGHVTNHVRFSIRSPQAVTIAGRRFAGFVDVRLLRCVGPAFAEPDLVTAHRTSRLVAVATELAAARAVAGEHVAVTAFDHTWHLGCADRRLAGHAAVAP